MVRALMCAGTHTCTDSHGVANYYCVALISRARLPACVATRRRAWCCLRRSHVALPRCTVAHFTRIPRAGRGLQASLARPKRGHLIVLAAALFVGLVVGYLLGHQAAPRARPVSSHQLAQKSASGVQLAGAARGVLVLYSFFDGDEVSWDNLRFFVRHAILPEDGAQYLVILNGVTNAQDSRLPPLPANARFVVHKNECYDWGTYAWALETEVKQSDYSCAH